MAMGHSCADKRSQLSLSLKYSPTAGVLPTIFKTIIRVAKYTLCDVLLVRWFGALLRSHSPIFSMFENYFFIFSMLCTVWYMCI